MKKDKALLFSQIALHNLPVSFIEFIEILDTFNGNNESTDKIRLIQHLYVFIQQGSGFQVLVIT